jgi:hypothetical protein
MMGRSLVMVAVVSAALFSFGCTNEVAELFECAMICEHYDDCVAEEFDTTGCTDTCEDEADLSDAYEARVFECDECLDAAECSATCNATCADIIPAF